MFMVVAEKGAKETLRQPQISCKQDSFRIELLAGTVPADKLLLAITVPSNKLLLAGTISSYWPEPLKS